MHPKGARSRAPRQRGAAAVIVSGTPQLQPLEPRLLLAAGDFDTTFGGGDGAAVIDFATTGSGGSDFARSMAIDPANGKIILAGTTGGGQNNDDRIALARLNPDGSPDATFGSLAQGIVSFPVRTPGDVEVAAVAVSPVDGKIVVVGEYRDFTSGSPAPGDWLIARFNTDGSIDTTFGGDGFLILDAGFNLADSLNGVAVQADGKVVATGVATRFSSDLATIRLNPDGSPDSTFNGNGRAFVDFFGGADFASDIILHDGDAKIVVAGGAVVPGGYRRFVLLRYKPDGSPDNSFDADGRASTDFGETAFARALLRQPDGKYVVGGLVGASPNGRQYYAFARYHPDGSPDSSFGASPTVPGTTSIRTIVGSTFASYGIARQADGAILFAGTTFDSSFNSFAAVIRLTSSGAPDRAWASGNGSGSGAAAGDGVRLYTAPGTAVGDNNGADVAISPGGNIVVAGYTFGSTVNFTAMKLHSSAADLTPPTVTAAQFEYHTRQGVRLSFSEDVAQSIAPSDLRLERLGAPGESYPALFVNDNAGGGAPTVATWYFGGDGQTQLPDGNYRATLPAAAVSDPAGNPMPADVTFDFFVLAADANRDRTVNFNDLAVLAHNYNTTAGQTFAGGDFNYDGNVNFDDLALLAQRYNTTLAPPVAAGGLPLDGRDVRPEPVFSTTPMYRPAAKSAHAAKPARPRPVPRPRPVRTA